MLKALLFWATPTCQWSQIHLLWVSSHYQWDENPEDKLLICKEYYVRATLLWNEQIAKVVRQRHDYQCAGIKWAGGSSFNIYIMTPSNGNIFCVIVPLYGESIGHPYKGTVIWTIDVSLLLVWTNCSTNTRLTGHVSNSYYKDQILWQLVNFIMEISICQKTYITYWNSVWAPFHNKNCFPSCIDFH